MFGLQDMAPCVCDYTKQRYSLNLPTHTYERNSFALLHFKLASLEERSVLVTMGQVLHTQHILPHPLHCREPAPPHALTLSALNDENG